MVIIKMATDKAVFGLSSPGHSCDAIWKATSADTNSYIYIFFFILGN